MFGLALRLSGSVPSFWSLAVCRQQPSVKILSSCYATACKNAQRTFTTTVSRQQKAYKRRFPNIAALDVCRRVTLFVSAVNMNSRGFHTTNRNGVPPVFLFVARMASIISGRSFRRWWQRLTPEKREYYKSYFLRRKSTIVLAVGILTGFSTVHYFTHLQETPVTHRRRYVALTPKQLLKIAQYEYETQYELVKDKIVPPNHPVYKTIVDIIERIVKSNQDLNFLQEQKWSVIVVEDDAANAYVLPTGHVFVNTGLGKVVKNEDQLAVIIGHEMSHALLGHAAEQLSFGAALEVFVIVTLAAIWAFMPTDGIALITQWFYNKAMQLMLRLPYSRKLELEADEVGLQLIAKACYDVRESTVFWTSMAAKEVLENVVEIPEWLSTHPACDIRAQKIEQLIPKALHLRESCNCPALPAKDPQVVLESLKQLVSEKKKRQPDQANPGIEPRPSATIIASWSATPSTAA